MSARMACSKAKPARHVKNEIHKKIYLLVCRFFCLNVYKITMKFAKSQYKPQFFSWFFWLSFPIRNFTPNRYLFPAFIPAEKPLPTVFLHLPAFIRHRRAERCPPESLGITLLPVLSLKQSLPSKPP